MADKIVLIKLEVQEAGAEAQIVSLNNKLSELTKGEKDYELVLKKIAIQEDRLSKIQAKRATIQNNILTETKKTTKVLNKQSDATGSATAATMELSRVVSDAPYGIRGMANNITQLVSQLGSASLKAGGLTSALKLMWKSLMGPLGVVFAITAAVSALDFFYGANEKSKDSVNDFTDSLKDLNTALSDNFTSQDDVNGKIEEYIKLIELKAKKEKLSAENAEKVLDFQKRIAEQEEKLVRNKKFADSFYKTDVLGNKVVSDYEGLKIAQNQVIGREKLINDLKTQRNSEISKNLKLIQDVEEATKKLTAAEEGTLKSLKALKSEQEKKREAVSDTSEEYKKQTILIDELQKKIEAIEGIKKKAGKSKKLSFFKTPKELDLDVKSNEAALINFEKKIEQSRIKTELNERLSNAKTEEERLKIKKIYDIKLLTAQIVSEKKMLDLKKKTELDIAKAKTASHVADINRAFELYNIKIDLDDKLTPEQKKRLKADAGGKLFDALKQADIESNKTEKEIEARYEPIYKMFTDLKQARFEALFSGYKSKPKNKEETDLEKWARYAENAKAIISSVSDFVDSEFDRQMTIEQNKTNALNNELNKRLLNENLSKEQKEDIQNQIAQNDEKLRVKQEKIARKRFNVMKAFSLATALADTYLATQKAYTSQLQLDPTSPIRAKIAAGVALAAGLANVAAIARTRFESSSGTSPAIGVGGGSGGGSTRAEPSFNIVGRSNENILMSAIQSQFDQPLRAYVVARDVTNQQQLDGVITGAAGT